MLTPVVENVLVHQSSFCQSNAVVVRGSAGTLLVDPGVTRDELTCLARDLAAEHVVVAFSTHPHWDHLLWHPALGDADRYATAAGSAAAQAWLANANWQDSLAWLVPPDIVDEVPVEGLGLVTGLPAGTTHLPWSGPGARLIEHDAHARGHAAVLLEEQHVLLAGDMLSDVLVPMLDVHAADPIGDYLAALQLLDSVAGAVDAVVPGHGSVGDADELRTRIDRDRAYVQALRDGAVIDDPRIGPTATYDWVAGVHERQREHLAAR